MPKLTKSANFWLVFDVLVPIAGAFLGMAIAAVYLLTVTFPAKADGGSRPPAPPRLVTHNGSLMAVSNVGPLVEIRYVEPKPSLWWRRDVFRPDNQLLTTAAEISAAHRKAVS